MASTATFLRETTRALLVLALVFLNFAHAPAGERTAYDAELTAYLLPATAIVLDCGENHEDGDHAPCHACRIGGAVDLPIAPCTTAAQQVAVATLYAALPGTVTPSDRHPAASARAPPTV
jgi:hypothetical protein